MVLSDVGVDHSAGGPLAKLAGARALCVGSADSTVAA